MTATLPLPALRDRTTLRLGGSPWAWFTVRTLSELRLALDRSSADSVLILGGGSNMVCSDAPFAGAVIEIALSGVHVSPSAPQGPEPLGLNAANITLDATTLPFRPSPEDNHVWLHVAAGEQWDAVVAAACRWGLGGIECLSGIPGKAGATPIQNVGAYGQEVGDTLWSVTCMERKTGRLRSFTAAECELSYRHSRFKTRDVDKYVVVELVLRLKLGTVGAIKYGEIARKLAGTESPSIEHVRPRALPNRWYSTQTIQTVATAVHFF
jgi:UDP-N-acetylmuramate dehydrogenase